MSPELQPGKPKVTPPSNIYTVILAFAFGIVLVTAGFVAYLSYTQYERILP